MKRPPVNSLLILKLDDVEGDLHSRVEDVYDDDTLVIAQPSGAGIPQFAVETGRQLRVEWRIRSGIVRQDHEVVKHVDRGIASLVVKPIGEPTVIQRRDFIRVDVMLTVNVETHLGQEARGTTTDLSGGGMRAIVPVGLSDGQTIDVTIVLPAGEGEIRARAHTIRKVGEDTYAFGFSEIKETDRERVIRFVFARQQSLLRDGRLSAR
jgi:c-di-GMP-binding flagellar brake protein YcgR